MLNKSIITLTAILSIIFPQTTQYSQIPQTPQFTTIALEIPISEYKPIDLCTHHLITCDKTYDIKQLITQKANSLNYDNIDYLIDLAYCESRLDPKATNDKNNYPANSIDRGLFQINSYHHSEVSDECAFDPTCSTTWTIKRLKLGYDYEWVCHGLVSL